MLGPVFSLELLRGSRRGPLQFLRRVYAGWLVLQFVFLLVPELYRAWPALMRRTLVGASGTTVGATIARSGDGPRSGRSTASTALSFSPFGSTTTSKRGEARRHCARASFADR